MVNIYIQRSWYCDVYRADESSTLWKLWYRWVGGSVGSPVRTARRQIRTFKSSTRPVLEVRLKSKSEMAEAAKPSGKDASLEENLAEAQNYEGDPLECPCIAHMKEGPCGEKFITA